MPAYTIQHLTTGQSASGSIERFYALEDSLIRVSGSEMGDVTFPVPKAYDFVAQDVEPFPLLEVKAGSIVAQTNRS